MAGGSHTDPEAQEMILLANATVSMDILGPEKKDATAASRRHERTADCGQNGSHVEKFGTPNLSEAFSPKKMQRRRRRKGQPPTHRIKTFG